MSCGRVMMHVAWLVVLFLSGCRGQGSTQQPLVVEATDLPVFPTRPVLLPVAGDKVTAEPATESPTVSVPPAGQAQAAWPHSLFLPAVQKPREDPYKYDWPQFRHDAQRTAATHQELSGHLTIRWKRGFNQWPNVFAELAVAQGRVYFANMDGIITAMNGDTGNVLWSYDTGAPIPTTPAVIDGRVHVLNMKGRLLTFDTDGHILWDYTVPGDVYANPVVDGGRVFFGSVSGTFYAFDAANGGAGPVWTYQAGATIDTAPVIINGLVVFSAENMHAIALRMSDGAPVWTASLPGARSWNGHPVASVSTNKIYFSVLNEFNEPSSTYREVFSMYDFANRTGPLSQMLAFADQFISQNRAGLTPAVILDASTGQAVGSFTVAPDNSKINGLPFTSWYWGTIRPALWQGNKLFLQSMYRNILIDLDSNTIYQPNADQNQTRQFVRGDEQVPTSIGGNHVYGGIGINVASLNLVDGTRTNVLGHYGNESDDATPLTAPLAASHYLTAPADGYADAIGTLVVANGHAYYEQYGWVYCLDGTVTSLP
jgi:outer membrane protein assembly factor BamB